MSRIRDIDTIARVLAKHTGVAQDDLVYLESARGYKTPDGAWIVALFGNRNGRRVNAGIVVKHGDMRLVRRLTSVNRALVEGLLQEASGG